MAMPCLHTIVIPSVRPLAIPVASGVGRGVRLRRLAARRVCLRPIARVARGTVARFTRPTPCGRFGRLTCTLPHLLARGDLVPIPIPCAILLPRLTVLEALLCVARLLPVAVAVPRLLGDVARVA